MKSTVKFPVILFSVYSLICTSLILLGITASIRLIYTTYYYSSSQYHAIKITSESRLDQKKPISMWLEHDYNRRWYTAHTVHKRPQPELKFLYWRHVPKTGTSFVNTLIRWGCARLRNTNVFITPLKERPKQLPNILLSSTHTWDWLFRKREGRHFLKENCNYRLVKRQDDKYVFSLNMHEPMRSIHSSYETIMFFRRPNQRIYSSYLHLNYHYNDTRPSRMSLAQFLKRPRFLSQHTKLLIGLDYRHNKMLTLKQGEYAAEKIIPNLAFIGLTEYFQLSVRLFHAMFGGVPHRAQFDNVRPGLKRVATDCNNHTCTDMYSHFKYNESLFHGWKDHVDEVVYDAAYKRFWWDVCKWRRSITGDGLGDVPMTACMFRTYEVTRC